MRIAVVYDCLFPFTTGGGERQYRAFAERFAAQGHQVTYLTRVQWDAPPDAGPVVVRAVAGRARLYDERGNRRLLPAVGFALAVLAHLVRHRRHYDAVVVSALPALNVLAVRAALLGARTAVCADFLEVWRPEQWLEYSGPVAGRIARWVQKAAVLASPLASCHSRMNGDRLVAEGLRTTPVISPGLITPDLAAHPNTDPPDPPTVVYVGRMIPDKQVEAVPAALAWARERTPELRAVLFGEGETREAVRAEVGRLGLTDIVSLPGFVPEATLRETVRNASCLVNPSRREGYGLVVVEACASGTPAVLVRAPDNASLELVEPGRNGVVAASTRPEDLGAALVSCIEQGAGLRRSTVEWYAEAVRTKTVDAAADGILAALAAARGRP